MVEYLENKLSTNKILEIAIKMIIMQSFKLLKIYLLIFQLKKLKSLASNIKINKKIKIIFLELFLMEIYMIEFKC